MIWVPPWQPMLIKPHETDYVVPAAFYYPRGEFLEFWESQPLCSFDRVYDAIGHGDDEHRAWLKEAIEENKIAICDSGCHEDWEP